MKKHAKTWITMDNYGKQCGIWVVQQPFLPRTAAARFLKGLGLMHGTHGQTDTCICGDMLTPQIPNGFAIWINKRGFQQIQNPHFTASTSHAPAKTGCTAMAAHRAAKV